MTSKTDQAQAAPAGVLQTLRETPVAARFVLLGAFINQFAAFVQLFLVLYLTERGFSAQQAGLALGAYSVGAVLGTLFGGAFSDRLGPVRTIVLAMGSAALFTLSVTALHNLAAIVVAVALSGGMTQAARPAVSALLLGLVPRPRQVMVFAIYTTALNLGGTAGPLVAVWLSAISWNLVFYADAASALAYSAIAAVLLPRHMARAAAAARENGAAARPAARRTAYLAVLADRKYLAYLALMLANGLVHVQFFAVLPLMLKADGHPTWVYATATAFDAFLAISLQLLVTRTTQNWPAWVAVMTGWLLLVFGFGLFGLPGGLAIVFVGVFIAVLGQIVGGPAAFSYPAKAAPPGATGQYIGSAHAMFGLGYAVGPILGILLFNGIGKSFWGVCVLLGLAMIAPGIWALRPSGEPAEASGDATPGDATPGDATPGDAATPATLDTSGPASATLTASTAISTTAAASSTSTSTPVEQGSARDQEGDTR
jgi:MFS family permease